MSAIANTRGLAITATPKPMLAIAAVCIMISPGPQHARH